MGLQRAIGYCVSKECEDVLKGIFLLNPEGSFHCPRCGRLGREELEVGSWTGDSGIFKEVRVEYEFDYRQVRYRSLAIIRDNSLWGQYDTYTLRSPLIRTEKRALKVAEAILANLNHSRGTLPAVGTAIPRTTEQIISFDTDLDDYRRQLNSLEAGWQNSALRKGA